MDAWDAEDYYENSSEQQKWGFELLDKLSPEGNERILDLGCGDGRITADMARRVPQGSVVGFDKSERMITFARRHFSEESFPNLTFKIKDAREMDFDGEFDVVFSNAVLHWIHDPLLVLKGIKRSLKPGGRVLAQMGGKGNAAGILTVLGGIVTSREWSEYFVGLTAPYAFFDMEEYRGWLYRAGLTVKRIELIPKYMAHAGKEGLSAWIRTTWLPYTTRVPEGLRSAFINEIAERYIGAQGLGLHDTIPVKMVRLEFEAENR
ncbi:class I SAM-dependent methyltransferase [Syntrophorhabdus aromaticivorans]|uniref:class I SAM-dependent methyltransferase n=1 Tax=Syntrophorhabdus aromaticivorans TaxID=328301 RepID=UPI000406DED3|nr:class I SAM-dependent methyltransferase [Syntrophorhabdus aromaticivorans]